MSARSPQWLWIVVFLCAFVGIASAEEPLVVVHDGSFEASAQNPQLGHWALHGSGAFDNQTAFDGNVSAKLQGPQRFTAEWTYEFPDGLVAGREYVVSAWVKAERDGAVASLGVRWSGGYPRIYRGLQAESDWQRMEMLFTVPVPAPDRMEIVLSGDHDGALWWDRVEIFEARDLGERLAAEWEPRLARGESLYTGLIINAKGLGVERGMSPKVYDHEGNILFAGVEATGEQLISTGIVAYTRSIEEALSHPRLNVHEEYPLRLPLIVDAVDGRDWPRTGVVLGARDTRLIREALQEYDFFGRFAVVIVID